MWKYIYYLIYYALLFKKCLSRFFSNLSFDCYMDWTHNYNIAIAIKVPFFPDLG